MSTGGAAQGAGMLAWVQIARAAAALMVLVFHVSQHMAEALEIPGFRLVKAGGAGVDLFFVISGFIMVWSCRAVAGTPGMRGDFLLRRAIRVVPLYWTVTTVFVAGLLAAALLRPGMFSLRLDAPHVLASYLFVPYPNAAGEHFPLLVYGWTLNYEMAFYLAFALLLGLPMGRLVAVLTAGFAALVALGQAVALPFAAAAWTAPIILEFVLGAWLGLAKLRGAALPGWARLALLAAGLVGLGVSEAGANDPGFARVAVWGVPSLAIMAAAVLGPDVAARGRAMRGLLLLGDASYAIYLVHFFVVLGARRVAMPVRDLILAVPWAYALALGAVAVAVSVAVHLWVERPMQRGLLAWRGR